MMNVASAIGKCQNHVPYSCANGMYLMHGTYESNLWYAPKGPDKPASTRKEAPYAGSTQSHSAPPGDSGR